MMKLARPVHPGEMLKTLFIEDQDLSIEQVAELADIPVSQLEDLVGNRLSVDEDLAVKLGHFSGTSTQFWLNAQRRFEESSKSL